MPAARTPRPDAAAGIAFVALVLVATAIPGEPPLLTDPVGDVREFFVDKRDDIQASTFLTGLGAIAFLWFLGTLRERLRRAEPESGGLAAVAFGSGIVLLTLALIGQGLLVTGTLHTRDLDDSTLRALYDAQGYVFLMTGFAAAGLVGATSASALRSGALPRWTGFGGAAIAALAVIGSLSVYGEDNSFLSIGGMAGFLVFLLFLAWVLAVSITLMVAGRRELPEPPPA